MAKEEELMIITIFKEVAQVDSTDPSKLDVLFQQKQMIDKLERQRRKNQGMKWYLMLAATLLMGLMQYFLIIPSIQFMFGTLRENSSLSSALKKFIAEVKLSDVITNDVLLISWDFNNRTPYYFTKST